MRRRVMSVLGCLVLSQSSAAAQGTPPSVETTAGQNNQIAIDLNAASQTGRVKFDVPIVLQMSLDPDVTRVEVFSHTSETRISCTGDIAFKPANVWRRFTLGRTPSVTTAETKTPAFITVPPVAANRYICFKFSVTRSLSAAELATFNSEGTTEAEAALRVDSRIIITSAQVDRVRQALRRVLGVTRPLAKTEVRRDVNPGSILSAQPSIESTQVFERFLGAVFGATRNRESIAQSLDAATGQTERAAAHIKELATNPFLETYQKRLLDAAAVNAGLAQRFRSVSASIDRIRSVRDITDDRTMARARAVAMGLEFNVVATQRFQDLWDTTSVLSMAAVSKRWLDDIDLVATFVFQTQPDVVSPPLDNGAVAQLRQQLESARESLGEVSSAIFELNNTLVERQKAIVAFVANIGDRISADAFIGTDSFADFDTRAMWYMSADVGVASAPRLKSAFPYVGGNIYFRPVNKDAPLSVYGGWGRRVSAMVGASFLTDLTSSGRVDNSLGTRMLLVGGGYRLTDILRAGGGFVIVKAANPNPLITNDSSFQRTHFFSLSIDWDARTTFKEAFTATNGQK